jgi:AraC-like DNA-binding protein
MHLEKETNKAYMLILLNQGFATSEQVLEGTGLCIEEITSLSAIDFETVQRVVHNLERYSHDPIWATNLGSQLGITSHGAVGFAALSAKTLGQALMTFIEWEQIRSATYSSEIFEDEVFRHFVINDITGDDAYHFSFFQAFSRALEILIGTIIQAPNSGMTEIHFIETVCEHQVALRHAFDSTLFFGAARNMLSIPKSWWEIRSPVYDRDAYISNLKKCEELLFQQSHHATPDFMVKTLLRKHFEMNVSLDQESSPPPRLVDLATKIHVSERTLIRRLDKCGTTYKKILEDTRRLLAAQLLKEARYSIADVSDLLGYQAPANFCRAFNRWYGLSPKVFRKRG